MAIYDNKHWLLSHIRNSFISTDDTGMCETVMANEDFPKQLPRQSKFDIYPGFDDSSEEDDMDNLQESYDIQYNYLDNRSYRQRTNTAQYLEKMNIARKKAAKIKNIKWESTQSEMTEEEKAEAFIKKDISKNKENNLKKKTSLLSELIEKSANLPNNPFIEYSKFDGSGRVGIPTRKYKIFMTMLPESERNYPLSICIVSTAKIQDLIGLTCLKYSMTHGDYQFKSISQYGLYITEDDGEVDRDFPALDSRECISKFGFNCLGLVEHEHKKSISFESNDYIKSDPLNENYEETADKKSKTLVQDPEDLARMRGHATAMEAPLYQSYRVMIINKVLTKTEVNLGISGEKIEIDPVQQKNPKFWVRQKAVCYKIDNIAWCELLDCKVNRATFRLVYGSVYSGINSQLAEVPSLLSSSHSPMASPSSFKHHDFEADQSIAEEIVQKINHILELHSSTSRKEYLAVKEKKAHRRRSFHLVYR